MSKTINVKQNSNIDDIIINNPKTKIFKFREGDYFLNDILLITEKDIKFKGIGDASKINIYQNNVNKDGLDIEGDNFVMENISIHVPHDDKIAITVAGCNNTIIKKCIIYGNANTFSIFYAGPQIHAGEETINAFMENNLDNGNKFLNNIVYSKWSGDAISFSLQSNGEFYNNIVRGGKLAVYMCRNTIVKNNVIYDSTSEGIYISLPSQNVKILNNKIYECESSAIKTADQLEHGIIVFSDNHNISISKNKIRDSGVNCIELNNAKCMTIDNNKITGTNNILLYSLNSREIFFSNNDCAYFKIAIWLEKSYKNIISDNKFYSLYPYQSEYIIQYYSSKENEMINNTIRGMFQNEELVNGNSIADNIYDNNDYKKYYTYKEEIKMLK